MTALEPGTVVWAPFPWIDRKRTVPRPALIIARHRPAPKVDFLWCLMITNARHEFWPGDVAIAEGEVAGLADPSKVRTAKVALFLPRVVESIGRVSPSTMTGVRDALRGALGLAA